jgi:hypothetical protein
MKKDSLLIVSKTESDLMRRDTPPCCVKNRKQSNKEGNSPPHCMLALLGFMLMETP